MPGVLFPSPDGRWPRLKSGTCHSLKCLQATVTNKKVPSAARNQVAWEDKEDARGTVFVNAKSEALGDPVFCIEIFTGYI